MYTIQYGITWVDEGLLGYPRLILASEEAGFDLIGVPDTTAATYRDGYVAMTLAALNFFKTMA